MPRQRRLVLVLGKFRVVKLMDRKMTIKLGGTTEMTVDLPAMADVRDGDLLTLYTEVLLKGPDNAPQA
jgi:hypothetical protein